MIPLIAVILSLFSEIHITSSHRLITNPYPISEWDSIIVSSDPIKITERKANHTSDLLHKRLRPQERSFNDCPQNDFKCLYGSDKVKGNSKVIEKFFEQYSNEPDEKVNDEEQEGNFTESDNARKSYWTMIDSQTHHHPYDDKHGWVTLDPVPWSTSKISKWHPNKVDSHQESKPWGYIPTTQRPVQQFWVSGSSLNTQRPTTQWGIGTNDLITDNKPNGFPTENYEYGSFSQSHHNYHGPTHQRPQSLQEFPETNHHHYGNGFPEYHGNYKDYQQSHGFKGHHPSKFGQKSHPSTYPSSGNGEWVLLSTTKGYSLPHTNRWAGKSDSLKTDQRSFASRKIKPLEISRYHEEDLNEKFILAGEGLGNRKSDLANEALTNKLNDEENTKTPLQILYTGTPKTEDSVKTMRRKVRLHVLPSLESTSTSYGGLLEVESNSQTVEEAQQEDEKLKKLNSIANVKKNKFRGYKLVPTSKVVGKGMSQSSAVTLAAVGAGMIPATMAILVPMALGRRRRSVPDSSGIIYKRL